MPTTTRTNGSYATVRAGRGTRIAAVNPAYLYVEKASGSLDENESFLTFSSPVPPNAQIESAILTLTSYTTWTNNKAVTASRVTSNWSVSKLSWANRPSVSSADAVTSPVLGTIVKGTKINIDVTSHMQAVSNGAIWYGWKLNTQATGGAMGLYGSGVNTPKLVITYSFGPKKPTKVAPGSASETLYIGTGQPDLFIEPNVFSTGLTMDRIQVQISSTSTTTSAGEFSSVLWNSGEVVSTEPVISLSQIAGSPVAANNTGYWWIGRLRDTTGAWTPWSDPVKYNRKDYSTLTLTNPPAAPNNFVEDTSPPITWTFSGVQEAYKLDITKTSTAFPLWSSGKVTSTATTAAPADGTLTENNQTYTASVNVWDAFRRESATSGGVSFPTFTTASRDFTYNLTSDVTPVTDLILTDNAPFPYVTLTFSRTTDPDYFVLVRDGKVVESDILPTSLNKVGTTYTYIDYFPPAMGVHTWEVRAEVNNRTSSGNAIVTGSNQNNLAWIIDTEEDIYIPIAGLTPVEAELYEKGETYTPLNSEHQVRITSSLGSYRGTVNGSLCGPCLGDGTTSTELQDRLLTLRDTPGKVLRLVISNISCPVVIYNVTTAPKFGPEFGQVFTAAFDWHQVSK